MALTICPSCGAELYHPKHMKPVCAICRKKPGFDPPTVHIASAEEKQFGEDGLEVRKGFFDDKRRLKGSKVPGLREGAWGNRAPGDGGALADVPGVQRKEAPEIHSDRRDSVPERGKDLSGS